MATRPTAEPRGATRVAARLLLAALPFSAAGVPCAWSSAFTVSPIQAELSAAHRTAVVTVQSEQDTPMLLQAQALAWSQPGGENSLLETTDVIATPAVFTLGPHGKQVVRLALRSEPDPRLERDFRLIVEEVPTSLPKDFTGLNIALRLSLPVFVLPPVKSAADLHFSADWDAGTGRLTIAATNGGTGHVQVRGFKVRIADEAPLENSVLRYVLPGSRALWQWDVPPVTAAPKSLEVEVDTDQGPVSATVNPAAQTAQP